MMWGWKGACKFISPFSYPCRWVWERSEVVNLEEVSWDDIWQTLPLFYSINLHKLIFSIFSTPISWYSSSFSDLGLLAHLPLILFDFTRSRSTTSHFSLTLVTHFFWSKHYTILYKYKADARFHWVPSFTSD
jgi:hypothetical protein